MKNQTMTEWMIELKKRETSAGGSKRSLMRQKIYLARHWDPSVFDLGHISILEKMEVEKDGDN